MSRHVVTSAKMMKSVMATWTGIQNRWSATPVPGCMIENDEGGDLLHKGLRTTDS